MKTISVETANLLGLVICRVFGNRWHYSPNLFAKVGETEILGRRYQVELRQYEDPGLVRHYAGNKSDVVNSLAYRLTISAIDDNPWRISFRPIIPLSPFDIATYYSGNPPVLEFPKSVKERSVIFVGEKSIFKRDLTSIRMALDVPKDAAA